MIGSGGHEGCPMNGQNEIPKMLYTRHKVSQGENIRHFATPIQHCLNFIMQRYWTCLCEGEGCPIH